MSDREDAAKAALSEAYRQLADCYHEPRSKHVYVHIFDVGLTCDRCQRSWDGAWESEDHRVCRECVDSIMSEVMG
jgi:hypothetical protein